MNPKTCALICLVLFSLLFGGCDNAVDDPTPPDAGINFCGKQEGSCGRTIEGTLCTGWNGGNCECIGWIGGKCVESESSWAEYCGRDGTCSRQNCSLTQPQTCPENGICVGGNCEAVFQQTYQIHSISARMGYFNPEGDCWDYDCGWPDAKVRFLLDGEIVGETKPAPKIRQPRFPERFNFYLPGPNRRLTVELYDADRAESDLAWAETIELDIPRLKRSEYSVGSGSDLVQFRITLHL